MSPSYYTGGLLMVGGKPVGAVSSFSADAVNELLGVAGVQDRVPTEPFAFEAGGEAELEAWGGFCREAGMDPGGDVPLVDLTVWAAIDPARPMPILNVSEGTEVITVCRRGGGSIGRVWRGARLTVVPSEHGLALDASHPEPLP